MFLLLLDIVQNESHEVSKITQRHFRFENQTYIQKFFPRKLNSEDLSLV